MSENLSFLSSPSALEAPEIITNPGFGFGDDQRPFQGIPGIERSRGGRLCATWYAGGHWESWENYCLLVISDDDGVTWSSPQLVVQPGGTVRAFDPCLWLDPQGRLWLFWAQSMAVKEPDHYFMDGRHGVWAIVCDNPDVDEPVWSEPRRIGDGIMMNKPTVLSNGDWILPISIWNQFPERVALGEPVFYDMSASEGAYAVASRDEGKTFEYLGKCDQHTNKSFDEHMIVERKDTSLWMLIRVKDGIWESESTDGGNTWNTGCHSSIPHESCRIYIRRLQSGNLLLVRHAPPSADSPSRAYLTAFLSDDDGKSWQGGLLLDERSKVSYPDGTQAPDGSIYIIYDYNRQTDKQILMTSFTESDVLACRFDSPGARQKVLVNQATAINCHSKEKAFVPKG